MSADEENDVYEEDIQTLNRLEYGRELTEGDEARIVLNTFGIKALEDKYLTDANAIALAGVLSNLAEHVEEIKDIFETEIRYISDCEVTDLIGIISPTLASNITDLVAITNSQSWNLYLEQVGLI